jgi:hypothetical protein
LNYIAFHLIILAKMLLGDYIIRLRTFPMITLSSTVNNVFILALVNCTWGGGQGEWGEREDGGTSYTPSKDFEKL